MIKNKNLFITVIISLFHLVTLNILTYETARNIVINTEDILSTGGNLYLNPKEKRVNQILMKYKRNELTEGYHNPEYLTSAMHFFKAKNIIENSKIFKLLKIMPKGALLHIHNTAAVTSDWVIRNLTYYPGLMRCQNNNDIIILTFRKSNDHDCLNYINLSDERKRAIHIDEYDKQLEKLINLYTPMPEIDYPNQSIVWTKFQNIFTTINDLINYLPVFKAYHWRLFEEMYNDGIIYMELRTSFSSGYDDTGKIYTPLELATILKYIVDDFKIAHPGFLGVKIIYSTNRKTILIDIEKKLNNFKELYSKFPNFIIGFDLVGQEDLGKPLHNFISILQDLPPGAKYFFHAGETSWYGASIDYNILDAILMNTTRIGHGYALLKHPVLWNVLKYRDIPIEINLISNQVLNLLWDLRNHPASFYISENIPIVISNDDPGFWSVKGLSYDFYYALMSISSNRAGLKFLKQLVWNSIKYSVLTKSEQHDANILLEKAWNTFLDNVLSIANK